MPIVEANGLKFHTQRLGNSGTPIIMLHGLVMGSLAAWYFGTAPVLALSHRVLLYDLRGHGLSERPPGGYGQRSMAQDLSCLAEEFADEPATIVGHSYGGVVAMRYALEHPERVSRLVLVETPLPVFTSDVLTALVEHKPEELLQLFPESQRAVFERVGKRGSSRLMEQVLGLAVWTSLAADLLNEPDLSDAELESIQQPVLLCYATNSFTQPTWERLQARLPNSELVMMNGGHYLPYETAPQLAAAIGRFTDG